MPNKEIALDRIFHALADPTRMAVLQRLSDGPAPVSELAAPFEMALPSFIQHLGVLEDCKLVRSVKKGRVRTFSLTPAPMQQAENWLEQRRSLWQQRLNQLDSFLMNQKGNKNE